MFCPKCGMENSDDAQVCRSCNTALKSAAIQAPLPITKTSGLAIAALVLGIISFLLGIFTGIPAIILGIVALVKIEKSGGRITGKGFAIAGIVIPVFSFALTMAILMPALSRVRQLAFRMTCGTNLYGIGKSMTIYANDYEDEFPHAGGRTSVWANKIPNWQAFYRNDAYGLNSDGNSGQASISSCFYLLVKYAEVTPKSFICKADKGCTEFNPAEAGAGDKELTDLWDFGPEPSKHCSYAYHTPFMSPYALTNSSDPSMAVAADRNPWISSPFADARDISLFNPDGGVKAAKAGNAVTHQKDGQNVLYMDSHVIFETRPFCGIEEDNIYTFWDGGDIRKGAKPVPPNSTPQSRTDSLLVNDGE